MTSSSSFSFDIWSDASDGKKESFLFFSILIFDQTSLSAWFEYIRERFKNVSWPLRNGRADHVFQRGCGPLNWYLFSTDRTLLFVCGYGLCGLRHIGKLARDHVIISIFPRKHYFSSLDAWFTKINFSLRKKEIFLPCECYLFMFPHLRNLSGPYLHKIQTSQIHASNC